MSKFELIQRTLCNISFRVGNAAINADLIEDTLAEHRFTVIEKSAGAMKPVISGFSELGEAMLAYNAASDRVKATIRCAIG